MLDPDAYLEQYLERIGFSGKTDVSADTLQRLHTAHTFHVPFENLDVFYQKPVSLDEAPLFDKIVRRKRGGYCFEVNGLFSLLLRRLGFRVSDLLARPARDEVFRSKTHQVLLVEIGSTKWLVDVGYGKHGIVAPVLLEAGVEQNQFFRTYRIREDPEFGYVLQFREDGVFSDLYAFREERCYPEDFLLSHFFTAHSPDSRFTTMPFCTIPTEEGRITLTDKHLTIEERGRVFERVLSDEREFALLLKQYFCLDLGDIRKE